MKKNRIPPVAYFISSSLEDFGFQNVSFSRDAKFCITAERDYLTSHVLDVINSRFSDYISEWHFSGSILSIILN